MTAVAAPARKSSLSRWRILAFVATLSFFTWFLRKSIQGLDLSRIHWHAGSLALAFLFLQCGMLVNVIYLFFVFRFLGAPVGLGKAYQFFFVSALGRHLPGRVWQIMAMTLLASRCGINAIKSSSLFLINQVLIVLSGFLFIIFTGYFLSDMNSAFHASLLLLIAPMILLLAMPNLMLGALNVGLKLAKSPPIDYSLSRRYVLLTVLYVFGTFTLTGTGFYFLARAIGLRAGDYFFLVTVYPFAYLIGYLAFFVPGGFGVRESFIIVLLKSRYPGDQSALLAIAAIFWWYSLELSNCLAAVLTMKDPVLPRINKSIGAEAD